jgi:hypothetical protein
MYPSAPRSCPMKRRAMTRNPPRGRPDGDRRAEAHRTQRLPSPDHGAVEPDVAAHSVAPSACPCELATGGLADTRLRSLTVLGAGLQVGRPFSADPLRRSTSPRRLPGPARRRRASYGEVARPAHTAGPGDGHRPRRLRTHAGDVNRPLSRFGHEEGTPDAKTQRHQKGRVLI